MRKSFFNSFITSNIYFNFKNGSIKSDVLDMWNSEMYLIF